MSFQTLVPIRGGTWTLTYGTRYNVDGDGSVQLVVEVWRARAATVAMKADGDDSDLADRFVVDGWARELCSCGVVIEADRPHTCSLQDELPPPDEEGIEGVVKA